MKCLQIVLLLFALGLSLLVTGCSAPTPPPIQAAPTEAPTALPTEPPPSPTMPPPSETPQPVETAVPEPTETSAPATPASSATAEPAEAQTTQVLAPGMPASGIWISNHAKQGARAWIQFEVYYQDGQAMVDVLEACVDYNCDALGEKFEAEGCSGSQSPQGIPLRNGELQIDFGNIMPETVTRHSKLGSIVASFPEPEVITGTWIIPACDLWIPLNVKLNVDAPTPASP